MRGYSEFKGITYRLEFDADSQSFVQRRVVPTPEKQEEVMVPPTLIVAVNLKPPKRTQRIPLRKTG